MQPLGRKRDPLLLQLSVGLLNFVQVYSNEFGPTATASRSVARKRRCGYALVFSKAYT